jgi:hypothetical protein
MAKIKLTNNGFSLIPEGVTTFKIVEVEYKEDFGKMTVKMQTKSGAKHSERFTLIKANGEVNEGALKAFSFFAKTALNNFQLDEIDESDLVGCYITATVKHEEFESNKEPGKMLKSARLNDYTVAVGFGNSSDTDDTEDDVIDDDNLDDFLGI